LYHITIVLHDKALLWTLVEWGSSDVSTVELCGRRVAQFQI
jgi:hypothetical protein